MNWQIQLPYRTKAAPVVEIAYCARTLEDEAERAITRQLALLLAIDHDCATVRDALHLVGKAAPEQRRRLLDAARGRAGLPTTGELLETERAEMLRLSASVRAEDRRPARYAYTDVGTIIDLNARDDEIALLQAREESRRHQREQLEAERGPR